MTPELALLLTALAACALLVVAYRLGCRHGEQLTTDDITALNNENEHLIRDLADASEYRKIAEDVRALYLAKELEADSANVALRECQQQMMRGAAVLHHKRPNPHRWADPELEVVKTEQGGLAFTDAEWSRARARYDAIATELPHS